MLEAFLSSAEYQARADALTASHVNTMLAAQGAELVNGRPVAHIVSLGSFCLPSLLFQNSGLRKYSLPFDWIFSTPQMVRDCLGDDFCQFLNRHHYRSLSHERTQPAAEHELYREKYGLPVIFAHRDPTRDADYLYLVRCVTRFRELLRSEDGKLFVVISRPHADLGKEFVLLLDVLRGATANFALLFIELLDPVEPGLSALVPVTRTGPHAFYRFTPSSFNAQGGFLPDKLDEWMLLRLACRYKLVLKDSPWGSGCSVRAAQTESSHTERATTALS
jgi:hypothetical protein